VVEAAEETAEVLGLPAQRPQLAVLAGSNRDDGFAVGSAGLFEVVEHKAGAADRADGVGEPLAGDDRC